MCWRMASYPLIFDSVGIPLQNMPDFFALDSYPLTTLMVSQRTPSAHSPLPVAKNWSWQHSQQDGRKSTLGMLSLGNNPKISLAVHQYWLCFSPQQRDGLLRLLSAGRFWVFSTGNFLQSESNSAARRAPEAGRENNHQAERSLLASAAYEQLDSMESSRLVYLYNLDPPGDPWCRTMNSWRQHCSQCSSSSSSSACPTGNCWILCQFFYGRRIPLLLFSTLSHHCTV